MQTRPLKLADDNNRPRIMEMCSKPCRYLFIGLICYSCFDLLIAAFGACWGFVIVVVLWLFVWTNYGWSSREKTGLFRCLLIIYWFLSSLVAGACVFVSPHVLVCVCESVFVKDRWGWVDVSVLEMSRSHLHWSLHPTGEGRCLMRWLPLCFLPRSLSLFLTYACIILSLQFSVSYSPYIFPCHLYLHYNLLF